MKTWVQEAHAMVKITGQPNYKQTCLTVSSSLCKDKLLIHLQHYDLKSFVNIYNFAEKYFEDELDYGAIVGPFENKPFDKLHISPIMAQSKPDGGTRVIVDLSWPCHCSVNSC